MFDRSILEKIPSLQTASASVKSNEGFSDLLSSFKTLVAQHNMADRYGLALVHRHTDVDPGQRLMDFGRTLQSFPLDDTAQQIHGYPIRPKTFALRGGQWIAYEFELGSIDEDSLNTDFGEKTRDLIQSHGLSFIGLRRYSPADPEELEITESKGISLKVPWNLETESTDNDYATTFWAFPSGEPRNYRCSCVNTGSATNSNHNHIDQP